MQNCHSRKVWSASEGFSLVEVLAGVGLTTMVAVVITSLLLAVMASEKRLQRETDIFESMRLPAAMIVHDARFAVRVICGWNFLELYTSPTANDYNLYKFEAGDGTPDPNHLHRLFYQGGVLQRDDIVGWNLVPPVSGSPDATWFDCGPSPQDRRVITNLVRAPLPGQSTGMQFKVTAYPRS